MKLYFSPGACSLAVHIALREAGVDFQGIKVNLQNHTLGAGEDYYAISPRGYVPLLELDDTSRHTEVAALLQYVADLDPQRALIPPSGSLERLAVLEWLTFVSTELHKTFSPWLWHPDTAESTKQACRTKLAARFGELERALTGREYLTDSFTVADAYAFTIVNWSRMLAIDLSAFPQLKAYMARVAARPKVREAMAAEGLKV
ncbi:glutathione transferase GstA [Paraburkholderia saeva]|jgi:glutathione S-transferase|uniref:Glutathione S-transferase GST-6.0 n=1 Tax=Paraburkholderia saeva TaxID=2777537 RepID=A0A9N8RY64_9BURK|nr:glutathione transferase GstA [Paraburkholderia saeva]CAG4891018.1 Glutathione S-transferase GST-6.0 [Paraburkholderia saeva]CAG4896394.1 Glutathione S-transferase GST-6.0 [Paraburkholderia saeva]CAG4901984.1 Glutathione S-transferase GST-6.0 [Paraburkholderia saeva]